jgi:hypothetical protein
MMKFLIVLFAPASFYFFSLMSKYSSHHPVLRHCQAVLSASSENTCFTPIQIF